MPRPYQPSLLRLLHGATALLVPALLFALYALTAGRLRLRQPANALALVALHVLAVLQRGGLPLARSMASVQLRPGDLPGNWFDQIRRSFKVRG
jgi:hypothetical protein